MRSDYLLTLGASTAAGVTVNGDQSHTVETYDANGFYLDNRYMQFKPYRRYNSEHASGYQVYDCRC